MSRAFGARVAYPLFQEEDGGSIPTNALSLVIREIDAKTAKALNKLWHSRLPRIGDPLSVFTAGVCYAAEFDGLFYASAIWTHPISRANPQDTWLELRRLAIAPDAPRNTASRMLAVMARLIRTGRPEIERLISYQDTEVHTGGIYKAAGWKATTIKAGGSWTSGKRSRPADQSTAAKQRWEKVIRDSPRHEDDQPAGA